MSPFRLSFPLQPRVFSQPPLTLQPNFYAPGASSFLSMICRLFVSLCYLFRARFLCFHQLAASFCKIPGGVGYLSGTSAPSASLHPACPELRGEPRRARYPLSLLLLPRGTTPGGERADPFSRRSRWLYLPLESTLMKNLGGGGVPVSGDFSRHSFTPIFEGPLATRHFPVTCATWRLYPLSPQSIAHTSRRHRGGTPLP